MVVVSCKSSQVLIMRKVTLLNSIEIHPFRLKTLLSLEVRTNKRV